MPEQPISSLGLKGGDQLIVGEEAEPASRVNPKPATSPKVERASAPISSSAAPTQAPFARASAPPPVASSNGPAHVSTDGGILVHRASHHCFWLKARSYLSFSRSFRMITLVSSHLWP